MIKITDKKFLKVEKRTRMIIGAFIVVVSIFFAVTSSQFADWTGWIMPTIALFLGSLILSENGVMMWFKKSTYRKIDGKDFLGVVSLLSGGAVLLLGILTLPPILPNVSIEVLKLFGSAGVVTGIGTTVVGIFHMFV